MTATRRADAVGHLVLDRDGVINREHEQPVSSPSQWAWEDGAADGMRLAAAHGLAVSVVTNQSAVGRGRLRARDLDELHAWVAHSVSALGVDLVGIWACPHVHDDGCSCRKPAPGMVIEAIVASGVPPERTFLVGDDLRDLVAARAAGIGSVLVRTGKGRQVEADAAGTAVCDNLADAVRWIVDTHFADTDRPVRHDHDPEGTQ